MIHGMTKPGFYPEISCSATEKAHRADISDYSFFYVKRVGWKKHNGVGIYGK